MYRRMTIALLVSCILAFGVAAQPSNSPITSEMRTAANDAFQKQDWATAADRYFAIVKAEPNNVGARYRYGMALLNQDMNESARASLSFAFETSPNPVFGLALARVNARLGKKDDVYTVLEKALTIGGISSEAINDERDFAAMRNEPKFIELTKKLDAVANPCRARPEYRQFDFWIGEWAPQNPQGVTVGTSSIQLILKSCIIFENWNTPVSSGKSFNLYDVKDGKWHQTWVDGSGNMVHYVGGLEGDRMVLVSESTQNGKKTLGKMTFSKLSDGNVRQHGESSTDDGKTWTTTFDFKYVRVK